MMTSKAAVQVAFAVALAAWMAACGFQVDHSGTRYQCAEEQRCPGGYQCVSGFCELDVSGDDPAEGQCSSLTMLSEDFSAQEPDEDMWTPSSSANVTVEHYQGQLLFGYPADTTGAGRYRSVQLHRFSSSVAFIEVPPLDPANPIELSFAVESYQDGECVFHHKAGTLSLTHAAGEQDPVVVATVPYSSTEHRWWRLRETDGRVFWETSGDQASWIIHAVADAAPCIGLANIAVKADVESPGNQDYTVAVASINGGLPSDEPWCPISSITDDFVGVVDDEQWVTVGGNNCEIQRTGQLDLTLTKIGIPPRCGYSSRLPYDLTATAVAVEVVRVSGDSEAVGTVLTLEFPNGDEIDFIKSGDNLSGTTFGGEEPNMVFEVPYNGVAHRWWRLRGGGNTVYWEASPDGQSWSLIGQETNPQWDLSEVSVSLLCSLIGGVEGGSVQCAYDNLNVTPQ